MRPKTAFVRAVFTGAVICCMPLVLGGCFAMQKDLDPIRSDISVMERQFMEMQREQARLRVAAGGMSAEDWAALPPDDTSARISRIEARLDMLEKRVAELSRAGGAAAPSGIAPEPIPAEPMAPEPVPEFAPEAVPEFTPEPVTVEPIPETTAQPPVMVTTGTAPTTPAKATQEAEDIYAQAMSAYKAGDMQKAEAGFRSIVEGHPDNRLADNAAYWIGEIRFSRKDYTSAIESFRKVVTDYPVGDKVPDAVYMSGRSYEELGQPDKARESYKRVMDNYPYSDAARNARQRLDGAN